MDLPPSATHLVAAAGEARVPLGQDALHPQEKGALDLVLWDRGAEGGSGRETGGAAPRSLPRLTGEKPKADCDGPTGSQARLCLTLDKVRVVGLMSREHRCHLVVVGRVDVFVNAIPGQFYL